MTNLRANKKTDYLKLAPIGSISVDPCQRAWIEVNTSSIEHNARYLKKYLDQDCLLMAVVKADGYGHGAVAVSNAALKGGADCLGVATLQEAIELRQSGLQCSILILGNLTNTEDLKICFDWDLIPTLSGLREALLCESIANRSGRKFPIHLKVDTGMTRLGCDLIEAPALINNIQKLQNVDFQGLYSHLALADLIESKEAEKVTSNQRKNFESLFNYITNSKSHVCLHLANSAGTFRDKNLHYDMVRVGLSLYGYSPINLKNISFELEPALSVKARITLIRDVPSGVGVGYGHTFKTQRKSRLAVVAIGYADGINRILSGKIFGIVEGTLLPQVGSIAMDQLVIDITDKPDVKVGSVVTFLGKQDSLIIDPKQWCEYSGSIPWEVLCGFKNRLPRVVI